MAMRLLKFRDLGHSYLLQVHLDTSRLTAEGDPQPAFVREYRFSRELSPDEARVLARNLCKDELAQERADELETGTALPGEGELL